MKESRDSSYCSQGKPSAGHWPLALEGGKSPEAAGVLPVACIFEYSPSWSRDFHYQRTWTSSSQPTLGSNRNHGTRDASAAEKNSLAHLR
jgi:hypothetical protein